MLHAYIVSPNRYVHICLSALSSLHQSDIRISADMYESQNFYYIVFKIAGFLQPP